MFVEQNSRDLIRFSELLRYIKLGFEQLYVEYIVNVIKDNQEGQNIDYCSNPILMSQMHK